MKKYLTLASIMVLTISGSAMANSVKYNGNWPVTISGSQQFNGSHCAQLSGAGAGSATLDGTYYGGFQVVDDTILMFFDIDGSGQEPASLVFANPAHKKIGPGVFEYIQGGYSYDEGTATFGAKGGC